MPDWRPSAELAVLRARARMLARLRAFFAGREVLEVETPVLCNAGVTDPHLINPVTTCLLPGDRDPRRLYLQTSPEYAMKRLLAAGSGAIYQVGKAFRGGETGRYHNPEFTLVEWYRPGLDYAGIMAETAALVAEVTGRRAPEVRLSYAEAFRRHAGIDPLRAPLPAIVERAAAAGIGVSDPGRLQRDDWLDLLLSHVVAPQLSADRPTFLTGFPASQAALARILPADPAVAARFELFIEGIEVANGFQELTDAGEQRQRFEEDNRRRTMAGLPEMPIDERLLAALEAGLPECSGVALGFDRLVMITLGLPSLRDAMAFPADLA
ncbi:MAG: Elongation factor P--(R)-beta-lysine ligase [Gammaproteobacteria bacterium]|nr:Elongation factor P--(R)-beta-lysine ligase [Gammaproteobacteria bacterium]